MLMKKSEELKNEKIKLSKPELAYEEIKNRIITEEYKPGQVLTEVELSNSLGMSRTPVRTAISKLAKDGYIKVVPDQGIFVATMHIEELMEWYDVREGLEGMAARLFAVRKNDISLARLEECYIQHKEAHPTGDYTRAIELDDDFHMDLAYGACNQQLAAILANAIAHCKRRISISSNMSDEMDKVMTSQHKQILDAIKEGNPDKAEEFARRHINQIKDVQKEYFWNYYSNRYGDGKR